MNFLPTLRKLDAAAKSGSWAIAYGSSKMTPVEAQQALQRFLGGHAAAIAGVVEAAKALLKAEGAEEHCADPNCDICIEYRHLVSALAALEDK